MENVATSLTSPPGTGEPANFASLDVHREVDLFLAHEAELSDSRRYWEWADLVTEDFTYQVPVPRTPDNPFAPHWDARTMLIDESKWSLTSQWFKRLDPDIYELSWAENPPVRFRHTVSNIRVRLTDDPDVYDARSNVILTGVRQSDLPKFITAERYDTIVRTSSGLRLKRRWAVLDETVIDFPQLRILL
jgi:3-phenylpropionate/cinnamic acid dioxygenase small subunit